jgi:DNA-directed RNA polymerase II subunit RPB2
VLIQHQLDSFNDFVLRKLDAIVASFNPLEWNHHWMPDVGKYRFVLRVVIKETTLSRPHIFEKDGSNRLMTPMDARLRNFTYASNLYVDVHVCAMTWDSEVGDYINQRRIIQHMCIGKIPIMVRSMYCVLNSRYARILGSECRYDHGGYFIVNGNEKVVVSQDKMACNRVYVFATSKLPGYSLVAEIRSLAEIPACAIPKTTTVKLASRPGQHGRCIRVAVHHIRHDVPLVLLMKALGVADDRQVVDMVTMGCDLNTASALRDALQGSMFDAAATQVTCTRDACVFLACQVCFSSTTTAGGSNHQAHMAASTSVAAAESSTSVNSAQCPPSTHGGPGGGSSSSTGGGSNARRTPLAMPHLRISQVHRVLTRELLPHCGDSCWDKALFLARMTRRLLLCSMGLQDIDDRDSFINKRVDTPGMLMANLFRQFYGKMIKDMRTMVNKEINTGAWKATMQFINVVTRVNIVKLMKATIIDSGMKYSLATGNWGAKMSNVKQGVAQVLNRMTYSATLSHLRRINTPVEKSGKLVQPRKLHGTQWGMVCPCETPEGSAVGLVKNMATSAGITQGTGSQAVLRLITIHASFRRTILPGSGEQTTATAGGVPQSSLVLVLVLVLVNGAIVGATDHAADLTAYLRAAKCRAQIHPHIGIVWDIVAGELRVQTDAGRFVRPLLRVHESQLILLTAPVSCCPTATTTTWTDLVLSGAIEYLDVEETEQAMIAMRVSDLSKGNKGSLHRLQYTHAEIDPSLMLGVISGCIPFSDHNQAPRNTYQSAMGKQAIGLHTTNFNSRFDTIAHVLHYPQRPLVQTRVATLINHDRLPSGINAIVAIATFTGFNQEDSVIINQSAVDRGLFCSTVTKTYKEYNIKNHSNGEEEFFTLPDLASVRNVRPYNYSKLQADGFVAENTRVEGGDVIIGKCMPNKVSSEITYKDTSVVLKANESGFVDRNCCNDRYCININGDGYTFAKVRLRSIRVPAIGDKFATREGQKGTAGILYRQQDMPFCPTSGIVPDIIMNPHAIPSRMTIGQLMECLMGKVGCVLGTCGDSTPFNEVSTEHLARMLLDNGMEPYGNELLHNPHTGHQMPVSIFMGPTYYQRLKHMTADKIHSRAANGPVVLLTRQPAEGRAREGGLRLGEMEIECNWAHGCMAFLKERIMECSDNYRVHICKKCGRMATVNHDTLLFQCRMCEGNTSDFAEVRMPYTCKLLFQELEAMSVGVRLLTDAAPRP